MKFTLTIDCDNAAFYPFVSEDDEGVPVGEDSQLQRCVARVADCIGQGDERGRVYDDNGNLVGLWEVTS